jgi:hypothetical protein
LSPLHGDERAGERKPAWVGGRCVPPTRFELVFQP